MKQFLFFFSWEDIILNMESTYWYIKKKEKKKKKFSRQSFWHYIFSRGIELKITCFIAVVFINHIPDKKSR